MRLIDRLEEYGRSDFYGFHMPGHKRRQELGITSFPNPFSVDITEIEGFDNLHHAEGILRDSMEQAAQILSGQWQHLRNSGSHQRGGARGRNSPDGKEFSQVSLPWSDAQGTEGPVCIS